MMKFCISLIVHLLMICINQGFQTRKTTKSRKKTIADGMKTGSKTRTYFCGNVIRNTTKIFYFNLTEKVTGTEYCGLKS